MEINICKTKFVSFNLKGFGFQNHLQYHTNDCIDGTRECKYKVIEKVSKHLGIIEDEWMTWETHSFSG